MSTLYERDFYTWTQKQAEALRRLNDRGDVDVEHVAEAIEDLGREQRHAVAGYLTRILIHLLKLEYAPAEPPRRGWMVEVETWRVDLAIRLQENPGLVPHLAAIFADAWPPALKKTSIALREDGIDLGSLPKSPLFTLDQARAEGWFPERRDRG